MLAILKQWYQRYFSNQEAVVLFFILFFSVVILLTMGSVLAPLLASIVLAYLLDAPVNTLVRWHCPRTIAIISVFILFLSALIIGLLVLFPLLWQQLTNLFNEIPIIISKIQQLRLHLSEHYPEYINNSQISQLIDLFKLQLGNFGKTVLSFSLSSIPNVMLLIVYLVLVPLLVLFILLDRDNLLAWLQSYLPKKHSTLSAIWRDLNSHIGNYVRGKILEVIIITIVCLIAFGLLGLQYTILLSVLVGLSVIIPFVGAVVVTIPVVIIAFIQWGATAHFVYLLITYTVISILDANVLVPVLFSEAVDLRPVSIIVAILLFGAWWGFWGVFFAIPLAALVKTVFQCWPRTLPSN